MPEIDFAAIAANALSSAEQLLAEWLLDGKQVGAEWTALNPTRPDSRPGSFKVNLRTGNWGDFATGDKGGDLVSLFAYLFTDGKQGEAAKQVAERLGMQTTSDSGAGRAQGGTAEKRKQKGNRHEWTPILPVPDNAGEVPTAHYHYGRYSARWPYNDQDGRLLGYVCRFDRENKAKEVLPLTCCRNESGAEGWQWRSFATPRPMFGLEQLREHPDSPVLLVEGEKCAQAGQTLVDMPVMSWIGGSKAVNKIDFTPLTGRNVILWPDNDDPGLKAMRDVAAKLKDIAENVSVVIPPEGKSKGWDIADAVGDGWTADNILDAMDRAMTVDEYVQWFRERGGEAGSGKTPPRKDFTASAHAPGYRHTDSGAARDLVELYGDEIRYNAKPFGKWFCYTGTRWLEDRTNKVFEYLQLMIRRFLEEASRIESPEDRKALEKWVFKLEGMSRQKAIITMAETMQEIAIKHDALDQKDMLFNCQNVTLDLTGGDLVARPHDPRDCISMVSPVVYDPDATCQRWIAFLERIFAGDTELIEFMRRAIGYSLTGDLSEQKLFFAYGTGANGKSVFFETIKYILGDYAGKAPTEMLMQQQYNQIPTDVADLRGKRFVVASEVDEGRRWAEARIKDLTGGDTIKARRMREDFFEFRPTHKLWVFGNHKPVLRGNDAGIKRRLMIIPFTVQIPDEEKIPFSQMLAMLRAEASGILNWALEGYQRWWEVGLGVPQSVDEATKDYFDDNDILLQFIQECCITGSNYSAIGKKLWEKYHGWCDSNGIRSLSSKGFYRVLEERGFTKRIGTGNKTTIDGIDIDSSLIDTE